jgi:hypothetical protein
LVWPKCHAQNDTELWSVCNRDFERIRAACGLPRTVGRQEVRHAAEQCEETLRAYRARFRRRSVNLIPAATVEQWRKTLMARKPADLVRVRHAGTAYVMLIADPQLGKEGTASARESWERGVSEHIRRITRLRAGGVPITSVCVAFMGDEHEGVCNNYANQPHTVELNMKAQIELDFDLRVWTIDQALTVGLPITVVSVVSNHGEFTRNGSKDPVTSKYDNSSTLVTELVRKLYDRLTVGRPITWCIAGSEPDVIVSLAGKRCYFSHGHIAKAAAPGPNSARSRQSSDRSSAARQSSSTSTSSSPPTTTTSGCSRTGAARSSAAQPSRRSGRRSTCSTTTASGRRRECSACSSVRRSASAGGRRRPFFDAVPGDREAAPHPPGGDGRGALVAPIDVGAHDALPVRPLRRLARPQRVDEAPPPPLTIPQDSPRMRAETGA